MKTYAFLIFCLYSLSGGYTLSDIFNGRRRDGNEDPPVNDELELESEASINVRWFTQNLDHFSPSDERTWQQRYFVNDEFVSESRNVAFLRISGEVQASYLWMRNGTWLNYAEEFNAICFQVEHRYYGRSRPTEDLSTENLRYLTSEQALADLAVFIQAMNVQYNLAPDVKWIAFGGSYAGSLAAWLRMKYPHLVHGAESASSPILAQLNFTGYYKVVADDLRDTSAACPKAVERGIAQVEALLQQPQGQKTVDQLFQLCEPIEGYINNEQFVSNFFTALASYFGFVAQYNLDRTVTGDKRSPTLNNLCDIMTNRTIGTEVERLAALSELLLGGSCLDYNYDNVITALRNTNWDGGYADGTRQWYYQCCTEFGYFQTSDQKPHTFGSKFPLRFYENLCTDVYGDRYNSTFLHGAINRTNTLYGGLHIQVSNVVFVQGTWDPWHVLGITKTRDKAAPAIFINGTAHCANIYPEADDDLPQLKAARVRVKKLIASWLHR